MKKRFEWYAQNAKRKPKGRYGTVYILTNFENVSPEEHVERALYRIETVTALKYDPYLMIYNKPNAPQILKDLQRWCNNKIIFNSERDFRKYRGRKA